MTSCDCARMPGLAEMVGHEMPSPAVARQFLYEFHEEAKIEEAKQRRKPEQIAYIPEETRTAGGVRGGQSGIGAGIGASAVRTSASPRWIRMPRSSRAGSGKPCAPMKGAGLSTDAGGMGGDERGVGGRVSGRECAGDDGAD